MLNFYEDVYIDPSVTEKNIFYKLYKKVDKI